VVIQRRDRRFRIDNRAYQAKLPLTADVVDADGLAQGELAVVAADPQS
jgi:hypothetical protein